MIGVFVCDSGFSLLDLSNDVRQQQLRGLSARGKGYSARDAVFVGVFPVPLPIGFQEHPSRALPLPNDGKQYRFAIFPNSDVRPVGPNDDLGVRGNRAWVGRLEEGRHVMASEFTDRRGPVRGGQMVTDAKRNCIGSEVGNSPV